MVQVWWRVECGVVSKGGIGESFLEDGNGSVTGRSLVMEKSGKDKNKERW